MRKQILKLKRGHSTKSERRFMELLKELHIPFLTKTKVEGKEIDFVIGRFAIEIDGHPQDPTKNVELLRAGYTPIHLYNHQINSDLRKWLEHIKQYGNLQ